ncbi:hypothetical protein M885DRAFT_514344 [Pelagophyceae sp. CCMP2097]|nr:hypothetical protein M885DRAFT_514344 [Pelagophyceae sp. CCMP2097]
MRRSGVAMARWHLMRQSNVKGVAGVYAARQRKLDHIAKNGNRMLDPKKEPRLMVDSYPYVRKISLNEESFGMGRMAVYLGKQLSLYRGNDIVHLIYLEGDFGSFPARSPSYLDCNHAVYAEVAEAKNLLSFPQGIMTTGGVGLCSRWFTVATAATVFVPPLAPLVLEEAPLYLDGGVSFKLSRAGKYGRCAALSGLAVHGPSLHQAGLANYVLSVITFETIMDELVNLAAVWTDFDARKQTVERVRNHLDMRHEVSYELVPQNEKEHVPFARLAEACFQSTDLDDIKASLLNSHDPSAAMALLHIDSAGIDAYVFAEALKRARTMSYHDCLEMERCVQSWLIKPVEDRPATYLEYFEPAELRPKNTYGGKNTYGADDPTDQSLPALGDGLKVDAPVDEDYDAATDDLNDEPDDYDDAPADENAPADDTIDVTVKEDKR